MVLITIVNGVYKPTNITGGPTWYVFFCDFKISCMKIQFKKQHEIWGQSIGYPQIQG